MNRYYKIADSVIAADMGGMEREMSDFRAVGDNLLPEVELVWNTSLPLFYSVQSLEPTYSEHILKNHDAVLFANRDWTRATLYADSFENANPLIILSLYSYLVNIRTLLLHSSLVDCHGNGIMFFGPSGIGKTTQAELWHQFADADILNGDLVFVREQADGFYGYGSPWHGSSPYYKNAKVKLTALVVLGQATENFLCRLTDFDLMKGMMDQVFLPHWYPDAVDACLDTLHGLLTQVPTYRLYCLPDEDAVRMLQKELNIL